MFYRDGHGRAGMIMHLLMLPAGFLACFQFVPVIRHKVILFHRMNGYTIILLSLVATVGAFMIARNAFNGAIDMQVWTFVAGFMFLGSMILALYNIKRLQIEQHRAWMLRAWVYVSST